MKKGTFIIALCFVCSFMKAQTVTPTVYSNSGAYNSASGGSISWTVGEPISETYTTSAHKTTMGFHQPELGVATLIKEQGGEKELLVYPNPVNETLTISFEDLENAIYLLELIDNTGRSIHRSETEIKPDSKLVQMNLTPYAVGNYFLRISNPTFNKTIKINKAH